MAVLTGVRAVGPGQGADVHGESTGRTVTARPSPDLASVPDRLAVFAGDGDTPPDQGSVERAAGEVASGERRDRPEAAEFSGTLREAEQRGQRPGEVDGAGETPGTGRGRTGGLRRAAGRRGRMFRRRRSSVTSDPAVPGASRPAFLRGPRRFFQKPAASSGQAFLRGEAFLQGRGCFCVRRSCGGRSFRVRRDIRVRNRRRVGGTLRIGRTLRAQGTLRVPAGKTGGGLAGEQGQIDVYPKLIEGAGRTGPAELARERRDVVPGRNSRGHR